MSCAPKESVRGAYTTHEPISKRVMAEENPMRKDFLREVYKRTNAHFNSDREKMIADGLEIAKPLVGTLLISNTGKSYTIIDAFVDTAKSDNSRKDKFIAVLWFITASKDCNGDMHTKNIVRSFHFVHSQDSVLADSEEDANMHNRALYVKSTLEKWSKRWD